MTPYPEQIVRRALEHDRVRGTRIKPVKRLQLTGGLPFTTHFAERVVIDTHVIFGDASGWLRDDRDHIADAAQMVERGNG